MGPGRSPTARGHQDRHGQRHGNQKPHRGCSRRRRRRRRHGHPRRKIPSPCDVTIRVSYLLVLLWIVVVATASVATAAAGRVALGAGTKAAEAIGVGRNGGIRGAVAAVVPALAGAISKGRGRRAVVENWPLAHVFAANGGQKRRRSRPFGPTERSSGRHSEVKALACRLARLARFALRPHGWEWAALVELQVTVEVGVVKIPRVGGALFDQALKREGPGTGLGGVKVKLIEKRLDVRSIVKQRVRALRRAPKQRVVLVGQRPTANRVAFLVDGAEQEATKLPVVHIDAEVQRENLSGPVRPRIRAAVGSVGCAQRVVVRPLRNLHPGHDTLILVGIKAIKPITFVPFCTANLLIRVTRPDVARGSSMRHGSQGDQHSHSRCPHGELHCVYVFFKQGVFRGIEADPLSD
eukprot:m.96244 g.96244  ORF g.96244 m.96244 type:complete len:409 (-) comp15182_c1_seq1:119-1345(-)